MSPVETTEKPRTRKQRCDCGKPLGHTGRPSAACTPKNGERPPIAGGSNGHTNGHEKGSRAVVEEAIPEIATPKPPELVGTSELFDDKMLMAVCIKVQSDGFVPRHVLEQEFGPAATSQALAILFRTQRVLTEVRRPWEDGKEVIGYVWATEGLSNKRMKKLPPYLGFLKELVPSGGPKYADWEPIIVHCQWTNWVLAALPRGKNQEERYFERDIDNNVIIPAYCARAMFAKALPLVGKEVVLAERIKIAGVTVPDPKVIFPLKMPVVDMLAAPGHRGKGINDHEALAPGTKFEMDCMIPTSVIEREDFVRMVSYCGRYVRLSPARSSGYGDFRVIDAK